MHEKPAKVAWKRGAKKHKKGSTTPRLPMRTPGAHINNGNLEIEEAFELGVTLYAESNKTKKTGPYGKKELKLVIMEVDDDGSIYSILGALTINLNEFVGLVDHKLHVPIECDSEIIDAVGQPYFDITIRQGTGGTSASSGISSTGWTVEGASDSDEEDRNEVISAAEFHSDPVRPVEGMDVSRTSNSYTTMDSVPEDTEENGTMSQDQEHVEKVVEVPPMTPPSAKAGGVTQVVTKVAETGRETAASLAVIEAKKNNVHEERRHEDEETLESPPPVAVDQCRSEQPSAALLPDAAKLITLGMRHKRLSTINSEAGDEAMELEGKEDELRKFLESELGEDEVGLEGLPYSVAPATAEQQQQHLEPSTPSQVTTILESEAVPAVDTSKNKEDVKVPSLTGPAASKDTTPKPVVPAASKDTTPKLVVSAASKDTTPKPVVPAVQRKEEMAPLARPRTRPPPSRGCWSCFPGSGLICCQPALPREP